MFVGLELAEMVFFSLVKLHNFFFRCFYVLTSSLDKNDLLGLQDLCLGCLRFFMCLLLVVWLLFENGLELLSASFESDDLADTVI